MLTPTDTRSIWDLSVRPPHLHPQHSKCQASVLRSMNPTCWYALTWDLLSPPHSFGGKAGPPDGSKLEGSACTNSLHSSMTSNLLWQEESEEMKRKKEKLWREREITERPDPRLSKLLLRQLGAYGLLGNKVSKKPPKTRTSVKYPLLRQCPLPRLLQTWSLYPPAK